MRVVRLPDGVRQSGQESETISLFLRRSYVRNRVCIESFPPNRQKCRDRLVARAAGDYRLRLNPRGTKAHRRNRKAARPSTINERRRDRGRRRGEAVRGFCRNGRLILPWPIMREPGSGRPLHLCQRQGSNPNIAQTVSRRMPCRSGVYCTVRSLGQLGQVNHPTVMSVSSSSPPFFFISLT